MLPNFFRAFFNVGTMSFRFRNIYQWKNFHRHQSPVGFLDLAEKPKILFWGRKNKKKRFFFREHLWKFMYRRIIFKKKKHVKFFLYFLRFFEKWNLNFWKNYTFIQSFPQPNFTIGMSFLAIFHRPWVCWGLWKIVKPLKNCTWWSVETIVWIFSWNPVLTNWHIH